MLISAVSRYFPFQPSQFIVRRSALPSDSDVVWTCWIILLDPNHTSDCGSFTSTISVEWQQQQCESSESRDGTTSLNGSHPPTNCFHWSCSPPSPASLPSPLPANHPPARGRDKEEVSSREDMLHARMHTHGGGEQRQVPRLRFSRRTLRLMTRDSFTASTAITPPTQQVRTG